MASEISPLVQDLVHVSKRIIEFAYNHQGLPESDCEAVLFYALELITAIEPHCEQDHQHNTLEKGLEYMIPDSQLLQNGCRSLTKKSRHSPDLGAIRTKTRPA
jgi:hypothetical protein